jgi:hypothetical protein
MTDPPPQPPDKSKGNASWSKMAAKVAPIVQLAEPPQSTNIKRMKYTHQPCAREKIHPKPHALWQFAAPEALICGKIMMTKPDQKGNKQSLGCRNSMCLYNHFPDEMPGYALCGLNRDQLQYMCNVIATVDVNWGNPPYDHQLMLQRVLGRQDKHKHDAARQGITFSPAPLAWDKFKERFQVTIKSDQQRHIEQQAKQASEKKLQLNQQYNMGVADPKAFKLVKSNRADLPQFSWRESYSDDSFAPAIQPYQVVQWEEEWTAVICDTLAAFHGYWRLSPADHANALAGFERLKETSWDWSHREMPVAFQAQKWLRYLLRNLDKTEPHFHKIHGATEQQRDKFCEELDKEVERELNAYSITFESEPVKSAPQAVVPPVSPQTTSQTASPAISQSASEVIPAGSLRLTTEALRMLDIDAKPHRRWGSETTD